MGDDTTDDVTQILGPCLHNWINFNGWEMGDPGLTVSEEREVEGLIGACETCWDHMQATINVAAPLRQAASAVLALDEAASVVREEEKRVCHRRWPWRKRRR